MNTLGRDKRRHQSMIGNEYALGADSSVSSLIDSCVVPQAQRWIAFNSHGTPMKLRIQFIVILVASLCLCTMSVSHLYGQTDDDKVYAVDQVDVKANIKNKLENIPSSHLIVRRKCR